MNRVIFLVAICCLVFWVISPILLHLIGLEFNDEGLEQTYNEIKFRGIPICIILTLFGTIKPNDKSGDRILKTVLTLAVATIAFFFMIMSIFAGMCDWTNREILYTNKEYKEVKIIQRDYGCGATDSGPPIVKNFKVKEFTKYFISAKEIDIEKIDQNEWIKIEK